MARNFNDGNNTTRLQAASSPVSAVPATVYAKAKTGNIATAQMMADIAASGDSSKNLLALSSSNRLQASAYHSSGSPIGGAESGAGQMSVDVWADVMAEFVSNSSRIIYKGGASLGSESTLIAQGTLNRTVIGNWIFANTPWLGDLAEFAIWSVQLSADELVSLQKGFRPLRVRPQSLLLYLPMIREINEVRNSRAFTATGTVAVADHPRVY